MDYTFLLGSIENILGKSHKKARDNHAFHCPFCNHHKPKLEINFHTNEKGENPWDNIDFTYDDYGGTHDLYRYKRRSRKSEILMYTLKRKIKRQKENKLKLQEKRDLLGLNQRTKEDPKDTNSNFCKWKYQF